MSYIKMYLNVRYGLSVALVDQIYEKASTDLFEISLEFVKLEIFSHKDSASVNLRDATSTMRSAFVQAIKSNPFNNTECDHIFCMVDHRFGLAIGHAFVGGICKDELKLSHISFARNYHLELVMAHELGHNLGAEHDDSRTVCADQINLMYPTAGELESSFDISECTRKFFTAILFNKISLRAEFKCLAETNSNKIHTEQLDVHNLPGYIFSLSAQCRFLMEDSNSYACERPSSADCEHLYCYNPVSKECTQDYI
jgi:hypothetical protein